MMALEPSLQHLHDARATCRELMEILVLENEGLAHRKTTEVEARLQRKRTLTLRLEVLLQDIKNARAHWRTLPEARDLALRLAQEVAVFQGLAAQNVTLLQAAHQLRADMVAVIRDTMDARVPQVAVYGRGGQLYKADNGTRVLVRDA